MKIPKVELRVECGAAKIYVDGALHVLFYPKRIESIQSWRQDESYYIEYSFRDGGKLKSEYSFDMWKSVLALLDSLSILNK